MPRHFQFPCHATMPGHGLGLSAPSGDQTSMPWTLTLTLQDVISRTRRMNLPCRMSAQAAG
eukprot:1150961-Pelagomonas_calceolata.AAC.13